MLTSADHARHRKLAETESSRDLESRLVVGDAVSKLPMSASTSLKPRTTSRAFARGLPSASRLHFKRILLGSVLSGVASSAVLNSQTPHSKKLRSSFTFAWWNISLSVWFKYFSTTSPLFLAILVTSRRCCR